MKRSIESILELLSRADAAFQARDRPRAREELLEAQALAAQAGITSAYLVWRLAVAHDLMEEPMTALKYVREAIRLDPLAQPFRDSLQVILRNLRRQFLAEIGKGAEQAAVSSLYEALIDEAAADDAVHVAMANYLYGQGDASGALRIASAVTLLSPGCAEAWLARAKICRALGDLAAAQEAEALAQVAASDKGTRPLLGLSSAVAEA